MSDFARQAPFLSQTCLNSPHTSQQVKIFCRPTKNRLVCGGLNVASLTTASALPFSTREDVNQFITAVNSFHPALKHTWEISDTSLAFLNIKLSIEGDGLCTSVHYKPTDSHSVVICCIDLHIHHLSRIPFLILSFVDFIAFVVATLIFH